MVIRFSEENCCPKVTTKLNFLRRKTNVFFFCAYVPMCLCAYVPMCLCAYVQTTSQTHRYIDTLTHKHSNTLLDITHRHNIISLSMQQNGIDVVKLLYLYLYESSPFFAFDKTLLTKSIGFFLELILLFFFKTKQLISCKVKD